LALVPISRTTVKLYPERYLKKLFTTVFRMCVEKEWSAGHTQAIDSAPVKANAKGMDTLELRYLRKI